MASFNWTCPYCNRDQAVTGHQYSRDEYFIDNWESFYGKIGFIVESIRCANGECKMLQLSFNLCKVLKGPRGSIVSDSNVIQSWPLLPESSAKPQPDYIPEPIIEDYKQACRIRDLSPKASATLSRRCLQGMIRDFCDIRENTLHKEIGVLRKQVVEGEGIRHVHKESVDAIDHVRTIGNIGVHMEQDVNLVIDIEPDEAQILIGLIELLFHEWYVQRESRGQRLQALKKIAGEKEEKRKENPA